MAVNTIATYNLNGSMREFDFAFDYLARNFIQVTLIGGTNQLLTVGTDYTFLTATRIRTNTIFGPPTWKQIEIRRVTSTTERLVEFQDASILRADDLNLSELQVLHVAEEAREAATETIGVNSAGHLDARGKRIVNLGTAVDPGDALPLGQYKNDATGAWNAKEAAELARNKAQEWAISPSPVEPGLQSARTYATQSASNVTTSKAWATSPSAVEGGLHSSKTYAESSMNSANSAQASATIANTGAGTASSQATAAAASATRASEWASKTASPVEFGEYSAKYHATQSLSHANKSKQWAENPVDSPVEAGQFSSKHYAAKAEEWAGQAGQVPLAVQQVASAVRKMYEGFIGMPIPWPSATVPAGYLALNGATFSIANNPILALRYPSGVLPDLRRQFIRGAGSGFNPLSTQAQAFKAHAHAALTMEGGSHSHTLADAMAQESGAHSHGPHPTYGTGTSSGRWGTGGTNGNGSIWTVEGGAHTHSVIGNTNTVGSHTHTTVISDFGGEETRPDNVAFMYICMTDSAIPTLPNIGS